MLTEFAWDVKKLDEKLTCCALVDWLARWSTIQDWFVFLAAMQRAFPAIPPLLGSRNVPYNAELRSTVGLERSRSSQCRGHVSKHTSPVCTLATTCIET